MLTEKKFMSLKPVTRILKIADELKLIRDSLLAGQEYTFHTLERYIYYCYCHNFLPELRDDFNSLLYSIERRHILEKSHLLYHRLQETAGYPLSEKQFLSVSGDDESKIPHRKFTELVLILENLRSAFNIGSIIRSAEGFAVKTIYLTGFTPGPDNKEVQKTAKGAEKCTDVQTVTDISMLIWQLKQEGYTIVALETALNSQALNNFNFSSKTALLLGNEEIGITENSLSLVDCTAEIPLHGFKNSLNVANAASIAMYEYGRQYGIGKIQ